MTIIDALGAWQARIGMSVVALATMTVAGCRDVTNIPAQRGCQSVELHGTVVFASTWSPDGSKLAVFSNFDSTGALAAGVYLINATTGSSEFVVANRGLISPTQLTWSPTSRRLLADVGIAIALLDLESRVITPLEDGSRGIWWGQFAPEGDSLYYLRLGSNFEPPESTGMFVADLNMDGKRRFVGADGGTVSSYDPISFSPDGEWIAYNDGVDSPDGSPNGGLDIFVIRRDGTQRRRVTTLKGDARRPQWIHGGREIEFDFASFECQYVPDVDRETWSVDADGTNPHPWPRDLGDSRVQFSYPPAIDRTGTNVAMTRLDPSGRFGVLYTARLDTPWRTRCLFCPVPATTAEVPALPEPQASTPRAAPAATAASAPRP